MNMTKIIPEIEEDITIIKALEYLSYGWIPHVDNDDIIINPEVLNKRKDEYFLTDDKMKKAIAQLEYFIRNRNIELNRATITPVSPNSHNIIDSSPIVYPDSYIERNFPCNKASINVLDNSKIKSVQIKFMEIGRNASLPSYIDKQLIKRISYLILAYKNSIHIKYHLN